MPTTICIAREVPDETVAKVQAHLDDVALQDADWSDVQFRIERDDFTYIKDNESVEALVLYNEIVSIIRGEWESANNEDDDDDCCE